MSTTRDAVRTAVIGSAGRAVSGEELAHQLGVSRAAVAKHIAVLKAEGMTIEAVSGAGYRLDIARSLVPELVRANLAEPARFVIEGCGPTASTMDDARLRAETGAVDGTTVIATEQTGGRGRRGRTWASPPGGVYLTLIARPQLSLADAVAAPLAVSLGVAERLARLGLPCAVKWPNDIQSPDGRKLAGILMEVSAEADSVAWLLVGIGINVFPDRPFVGAAYAAEMEPSVTLSSVAAAAVEGARERLDDLARGGFGSLRAEYERLLVWRDMEVEVSSTGGPDATHGFLRGVDDVGRLLVDTDEGRRVLSAGDVSVRSRAPEAGRSTL